jgi:alanine racemase
VSPSASSSLPRALVSRAALQRGARAALARGGSVVDLRADAWGHGVVEVARIALDAGASAVLVDEGDVAALAERGIPATTTAIADVDPHVVFGMPGSGLSQAMRLTGSVLSTKPLDEGDGVSYGYLYRAARPTRVALVTGGYAQGIVRALGNSAHVEIRGRLHRMVGRVAMDVCVVEIGDDEIEEGDEVTYFGGAGPAAHQVADWARITGLTAAEIVTAVGMNARREHVA